MVKISHPEAEDVSGVDRFLQGIKVEMANNFSASLRGPIILDREHPLLRADFIDVSYSDSNFG
jgi:hypothetical protein